MRVERPAFQGRCGGGGGLMGGMRVRTVAMRGGDDCETVPATGESPSTEGPGGRFGQNGRPSALSDRSPHRVFPNRADRRTIALTKNGLTGACESLAQLDHIMVLHRGADADRALLSELMRG